jgi:hypothetical protein
MSTSTQPVPGRADQGNAANDAGGQQERGLPSLLYGEAEEELRAAVRDLFQERADWSAVLARTETSEPSTHGQCHLAAEAPARHCSSPDHGARASYRRPRQRKRPAKPVAPVPPGSAVSPPARPAANCGAAVRAGPGATTAALASVA